MSSINHFITSTLFRRPSPIEIAAIYHLTRAGVYDDGQTNTSFFYIDDPSDPSTEAFLAWARAHHFKIDVIPMNNLSLDSWIHQNSSVLAGDSVTMPIPPLILNEGHVLLASVDPATLQTFCPSMTFCKAGFISAIARIKKIKTIFLLTMFMVLSSFPLQQIRYSDHWVENLRNKTSFRKTGSHEFNQAVVAATEKEKCLSRCDKIDNKGENHGEGKEIVITNDGNYCRVRCQWIYRQTMLSMSKNSFRNFTGAENRSELVKAISIKHATLLRGRCDDAEVLINNQSTIEQNYPTCQSELHLKKPRINLVLGTNTWLMENPLPGMRDCPASRCSVTVGPGHSTNPPLFSHILLYPSGYDNPKKWKKVVGHEQHQKTAVVSIESSATSRKKYQPSATIDWLTSFRHKEFPTKLRIKTSYMEKDEVDFRINGPPFEERKNEIPIFISKCNTKGRSNREHTIKEMAKFLTIEQYGACDFQGVKRAELQPLCQSTLDYKSRRYDEKECTFFGSKFTLVLENTIEKDYITEKLFQPLRTGTVPIIGGDPSIYRHRLPSPDAAIFIDDFEVNDKNMSKYEAAASYIKMVMHNSTEWKTYVQWKHQHFSDGFYDLMHHSLATLYCDLCDKYAIEVIPTIPANSSIIQTFVD